MQDQHTSTTQIPNDNGGRRRSRRSRRILHPWRFRDPREASTQSLLPSDKLKYMHSQQSSRISSDDIASPRHAVDCDPIVASKQPPRRCLLVIYIHGYMGDTTSFKSFPAHVHGYLTERLRDTHTVYTKIYPRYKTYRPLQVAANEFGDWLDPNVDGNTDVVLVGHSVGGLIAADIVLLPPKDRPDLVYYPFRHRILGAVTCDSPFLGLNPRIAVAGIKSLVLPTKEAHGSNTNNRLQSPRLIVPSGSTCPSSILQPNLAISHTPSRSPSPNHFLSTPSLDYTRRPTSVAICDPNFNPSYTNDPYHPARGFWAGLWHFSKKHNHRPDCVAGAGLKHMFQHFQYAWCLINWGQLTRRYMRIRELENLENRFGTHVRWVNFYTVCSGRNSARGVDMIRQETGIRGSLVQAMDVLKVRGKGKKTRDAIAKATGDDDSEHMNPGAGDGTPNVLSTGQWVDGTVESVFDWFESSAESFSSLDLYGPEALVNNKRRLSTSQLPPTCIANAATQTSLSIGSVLSVKREGYADDTSASWNASMKTGSSAPWKMNDEEREFKKELDRRLCDEIEQTEREILQCERGLTGCDCSNGTQQGPRFELESGPAGITNYCWNTTVDQRITRATNEEQITGPKASTCRSRNHHRRFCVVPSSISRRERGRKGEIPDSAWVRVDMGDVDEVAAHCGLFRQDSMHYNGFLEDVCERIVDWVDEDGKKRRSGESIG